MGWIRAGWDRLSARRMARRGVLSCAGAGIRLRDGAREEVLAWEKIDRVFAYKRDCYTVDLICISFVDREGQVLLEVDEGWVGYQELIDQLPQHLEGCLSMGEWFMQVAFPAFEVNLSELYRRSV